MRNHGMTIVLEGPEGAGKTSQAARLVDRFDSEGYSVIRTREPGGSPSAERLRDVVVRGAPGDLSPMTELLVFTAARAEHLRQTIKPALARGQVVIIDRFIGSTNAIQGHARGIDRGFINDLHQQVCEGFTPDMTLLLDIDPRIGLERARARLAATNSGEGRFEAEALAFHERVREGFRLQAAADPTWAVIDASRDMDSVADDIWSAVEERFSLSANYRMG